MNRKRERIIFFIMILQASVSAGVYLYCKAEKWNLEEQLTVFLYPFFVVAISFFLLISGFVSLLYFASKIVSAHKLYFVSPLLIVLSSHLVDNIFFNELKLREDNFNKYQEKREIVIELILKEELMPDERGIVDLPEYLKDEGMAIGGRVYIVRYKLETGVYFCTFSGVMDSSAGFVYLTDEISDVDFYNNNDISLQNQYQDNWYFCGTD